MKRILFQTLEDRDNIDFVRKHGPFKCSNKGAFLGEGYYFWDTNEEHAHYWGKSSYNGYYIIGKLEVPYDSSKVFDLTDPYYLQDFKEAEEYLKEIHKSQYRISVRVIINWLMKDSDFKNRFVAIRASDSKRPDKSSKIYFNRYRPEYLNLSPRVQICYFSNESFKSLPFIIVYPYKYLDATQFAV